MMAATCALLTSACGDEACHDDETCGDADGGAGSGGSGTGAGASGGAGGTADLTIDYCVCMLANCHDPYHVEWGDDEEVARDRCIDAAAAVPQTGSPATDGNSLECRMNACEMAATDSASCDGAFGSDPCQ